MSRIKRVVLFQPASAGGNFEYVAIPRQGMLFLSGALAQWEGPNIYGKFGLKTAPDSWTRIKTLKA